jgi:D-xylose transport system substrate-binding protein
MRLGGKSVVKHARPGLVGLAAIALAATACGSTSSSGGAASSSSATQGKIALLLPETNTVRYESFDKPLFTAKLQALGYDTSKMIYANANQDAPTQQTQAEAAITNGANVLVLDPVNGTAAGAIADKAKTAGIPVISYDRLIKSTANVSYYISFDNEKIGQQQATALAEALAAKGKSPAHIVMINGDPQDNNATLFKKGAHSVFDPLVSSGKLVIDKEYDTDGWKPANAQTEMQQAITALAGKIDGVYCANDGTAGGAIAALKGAGVDPSSLPITGQDAGVDGIQRVLAGTQSMTIYKAIKPEAEAAAQAAYDLATGKTPDASTFPAKVNNGTADVPSLLLGSTVVTADKVKDTVIKDGFDKASDICTPDYAAACTKYGIS